METFELDGVVLGCPPRMLTEKIRRKLETGGYEAAEARALQMRLRPGWRVLDLGGGLGYLASLAARITDPEKIMCVEAHPGLQDVIRANLALNGADKVKLRHGAVVGDDYDDAKLLFAPAQQFWSSRIAEEGARKPVEVPALRIGGLLEEQRPNLVVMDVEGAEQGYFGAPWPRFVKMIIMELHPKQYESRSVLKDMMDMMSRSGFVYDPGASQGTLLAMRRT